VEEEEDHDQEMEMVVPNLNKILKVFHIVNRFCEARAEETKIISNLGKSRMT
jgi:hypothetical protein